MRNNEDMRSNEDMRNNDGLESSRNIRDNRNMRNNRRLLQARRRRRQSVVIVLLTVICLVSAAFAAEIPQKLFTVHDSSAGTNADEPKVEGIHIGDGLHNDNAQGGGNGADGSAAYVASGGDPAESGSGDAGAGSGSGDPAAAVGESGGNGDGFGAAGTPGDTPQGADGRMLALDSLKADIDLSALYSPNAILMDLESGKVLTGVNEDKRIYPASLTKMMTAIVVLENISDWEASITVPAEIYSNLYAQNASLAGFEAGETTSIKALLYGVLLPSGAECCETLAIHVAGSESAFVDMMNAKARALGMENTHFCNTTGLHDDDHYSSVRDMAILLRYALENDNFREVFTTHRYSTQATNIHPEGFTFYSSLFKYMETSAVTGGAILGGKTGYTGQAGLCLASLANINGADYIFVTTGANGSHETEQFHILDAVNIYSQLGSLT